MEQEKSKTNKTGIIIWISLIIIILSYFYFSKNQQGLFSGDRITTATFTDMGQPLSEDIINCEFRVISDFVYQNKKDVWSDKDRKVYYNTSKNSEPSLITFTNLSTKEPKIKGNVGDGPLTILKDDKETIVLEEQNVESDIFIYTIFKKEKVATWYKSYKMITAPYGLLSMGFCY